MLQSKVKKQKELLQKLKRNEEKDQQLIHNICQNIVLLIAEIEELAKKQGVKIKQIQLGLAQSLDNKDIKVALMVLESLLKSQSLHKCWEIKRIDSENIMLIKKDQILISKNKLHEVI